MNTDPMRLFLRTRRIVFSLFIVLSVQSLLLAQTATPALDEAQLQALDSIYRSQSDLDLSPLTRWGEMVANGLTHQRLVVYERANLVRYVAPDSLLNRGMDIGFSFFDILLNPEQKDTATALSLDASINGSLYSGYFPITQQEWEQAKLGLEIGLALSIGPSITTKVSYTENYLARQAQIDVHLGKLDFLKDSVFRNTSIDLGISLGERGVGSYSFVLAPGTPGLIFLTLDGFPHRSLLILAPQLNVWQLWLRPVFRTAITWFGGFEIGIDLFNLLTNSSASVYEALTAPVEDLRSGEKQPFIGALMFRGWETDLLSGQGSGSTELLISFSGASIDDVGATIGLDLGVYFDQRPSELFRGVQARPGLLFAVFFGGIFPL